MQAQRSRPSASPETVDRAYARLIDGDADPTQMVAATSDREMLGWVAENRPSLTFAADARQATLEKSAQVTPEWKGWDLTDAIAWQRAGFDPQSAGMWQAAGFAPQDARDWVGVDPRAAVAFRREGFVSVAAQEWVRFGFGARDAVRWDVRGWSPEDAALAQAHGFTPDDRAEFEGRRHELGRARTVEERQRDAATVVQSGYTDGHGGWAMMRRDLPGGGYEVTWTDGDGRLHSGPNGEAAVEKVDGKGTATRMHYRHGVLHDDVGEPAWAVRHADGRSEERWYQDGTLGNGPDGWAVRRDLPGGSRQVERWQDGYRQDGPNGEPAVELSGPRYRGQATERWDRGVRHDWDDDTPARHVELVNGERRTESWQRGVLQEKRMSREDGSWSIQRYQNGVRSDREDGPGFEMVRPDGYRQVRHYREGHLHDLPSGAPAIEIRHADGGVEWESWRLGNKIQSHRRETQDA